MTRFIATFVIFHGLPTASENTIVVSIFALSRITGGIKPGAKRMFKLLVIGFAIDE
ncbi:hypothetical protein D3C78_1836730 [compost metagenome]